jgi:hypothetical protein
MPLNISAGTKNTPHPAQGGNARRLLITGSQQRLIHMLIAKTSETQETVWAEFFVEKVNPHFDTISQHAASAIINYLKKIQMTESMMRKAMRTEDQQIAWEMSDNHGSV